MKEFKESIRVALIAADPLTTDRDLLEEESEVIRESLRRDGHTAEVTSIHATSEEELTGSLRQMSPQIVEFTGHGSPSGRILLEDANGRIRQKSGRSLATILERSAATLECVVLNNCSVFRDSGPLRYAAENLVQVECDGVFDISLGVAESFYGSLAERRDYGRAYEYVLIKMRDSGISVSQRSRFHRRSDQPARDEVNRLEGRVGAGAAFELADAIEFSNAKIATQSVDEGDWKEEQPIWFATTRKPIDAAHPEEGFGREDDQVVRYGKWIVFIPKYHRRGETGRPPWRRIPWHDDRLRVISRVSLDEIRFWDELRIHLASVSKEERYILLFIHGFNVKFEQAVIRAGQYGADLNVRGATALFSWPSKGSPSGYPADEATIGPSATHLAQFLSGLASKTGAEQVHIIAHSMGNRALLAALNSLINQVAQATKLRFNQFFLAAPDVDVRDFKQMAAAYSKLSDRTTMYVSSKDKALWGSKVVHQYPRAGYQPPITIVDGVDTVDVSRIDVDFLGHSYIAEAKDLLDDMFSLMVGNLPPNRRLGLNHAVDPAGLSYWKMKP
jgi:esterase/lipase superfamily enzyme